MEQAKRLRLERPQEHEADRAREVGRRGITLGLGVWPYMWGRFRLPTPRRLLIREADRGVAWVMGPMGREDVQAAVPRLLIFL